MCIAACHDRYMLGNANIALAKLDATQRCCSRELGDRSQVRLGIRGIRNILLLKSGIELNLSKFGFGYLMIIHS
jgi:hypothetical protein